MTVYVILTPLMALTSNEIFLVSSFLDVSGNIILVSRQNAKNKKMQNRHKANKAKCKYNKMQMKQNKNMTKFK